MNVIRRLIFGTLLLLIILPAGLKAQQRDTLNISEAVLIGLEKNFSVRIARNNARIAGNNNSAGNAGFLPAVDASAGLSKTISDSKTEYSDGTGIPDRNDAGAETTVKSYSIDAAWTVFDGMKMFAASDRLGAEAEISKMEAQLATETVLAEIISTYYSLVGQQQAYRVLENTVEVSGERIRIAETKLDLGSGSRYDLLQARADMNADRAALLRSGTGLKQARIVLSRILADSAAEKYNVQDQIELGNKLMLDQLLSDAVQQNTTLSIARLENEKADAEIREVTGDWFPQIVLNGGYEYNRTESSAGFSDFNQRKGFNYGVTARVSLFDGFNKNRRLQNAQIEKKNEELRQQETEMLVEAGIRQEYARYTDALELIKLEEENLQFTEETLEIALEQFRLGTINSLELREAQLRLLNARNRLIAAKVEAKTAETELLRLSGRLLQIAE